MSLSLFLPTGGALALEVGSAAPDFELQSLDGKPVRLSAFRGAPVILKLATTWCPSCQRQETAIEELGEFLARNDVTLIEVFVAEQADVVRDAMQGKDDPFRRVVLLDPAGTVFNDLYGGYVVPRVLVLDAEMVVRRDGTLIGGEPLRSLLAELIAERDATGAAEKK